MRNQFSSIAFLTISPIMHAINTHPFNVELIEGTLPQDKFLYYMQQESLHLVSLGRALALLAAKMRNPSDVALMLHFSEQALAAERELHGHYFVQFGASPTEKAAPACFAYGKHLLERAALGSKGEGMAALLPCFWVYREVGDYIARQAKPDNPYARWIENYTSTAFSDMVNQAISLTDRLAGDSGEETRQSMLDSFIASARYEFSFCDDAYTLNAWIAS